MLESDFQELRILVTKTKASLQHGFRTDTLERCYRLEPEIQDLQDVIKLRQIFSSFRKPLMQVDKTWIPKGRIEQIVRACCNQRYREHDIERIFYEHGDINGLLVLHLGTRSQNALFAQLYALPVELREELAKRCKQIDINPLVQAWINCYDKSRGMISFFGRVLHD